MKKHKYILILIILINVCFTQTYRDIPDVVTKVATSVGNWLKLETDARAVGMGGAQVAAATGVSAVSYNPASIAFINKVQTYYSKTLLYADISHSTFALGSKLTNTDLAPSFTYLEKNKWSFSSCNVPNI